MLKLPAWPKQGLLSPDCFLVPRGNKLRLGLTQECLTSPCLKRRNVSGEQLLLARDSDHKALLDTVCFCRVSLPAHNQALGLAVRQGPSHGGHAGHTWGDQCHSRACKCDVGGLSLPDILQCLQAEQLHFATTLRQSKGRPPR